MLSLRLLNAEKVHSSESIHVSKRTNGPSVLVEGWGGLGLQYYQDYINDDPSLTLTYLTPWLNVVP